METVEVNANPITSEPTMGDGGDHGGSQPLPNSTFTESTHDVEVEHVVEVEPTIDPAALPPKASKKRKPNASGPRKTSPAWDHFTKLPESEVADPTAACNYCGKRYLCDPKSHGTTNMLAHCKICPKSTHAISNDPNQTVLTLGPNSLGAASHRFNLESCRNALAKFIILDEQPFRVVEGQGFKHLCRTLQPYFVVPSRHTIPRDCFKIYLEEKARLRALFRSDCSRVALTTDCWTSVQNLGYLVLTAHFIDNEWNYVKKIISFSVVPNHRGDTIGKQVEEILKKWGLRKVSTITVDNASSNDVAVGVLKRRFNNMNGLVLDGEHLHVRCCAHILNLVVNDGLKTNQQSISKIRTAVRFVRSSPQRLAKFKECVGFAGITSKKLLCLDVPTRWNSTYLMLESAEKFQIAFDKLDIEDSSYLEYFGAGSSPPNYEDWEKARAFMKFLKIFYDSTKVFSASTNVTIHSAFHQLYTIYTELKLSILDSDPVWHQIGMDMKLKYEKYWGNVLNMNELIYFGVILDPCYKLRYLEYVFPEMYNDGQSEVGKNLLSKVKISLFKMYDWYASAHGQHNRIKQSSIGSSGGSFVGSSVSAEQPTQLARTIAFKSYLKEKNSIDQKNEIERYLDEDNFDGDDKFELLVWWKQNSSRFPVLSSMARDVFATPISTVASESAFSTGGRILDTFRSCLNPDMAEALICTQNWLMPSLVQEFKELDVQEEFETSGNIVTEFHQVSPTSGGVLPSVTILDVGQSSQSQPTGCD